MKKRRAIIHTTITVDYPDYAEYRIIIYKRRGCRLINTAAPANGLALII